MPYVMKNSKFLFSLWKLLAILAVAIQIIVSDCGRNGVVHSGLHDEDVAMWRLSHSSKMAWGDRPWPKANSRKKLISSMQTMCVAIGEA